MKASRALSLMLGLEAENNYVTDVTTPTGVGAGAGVPLRYHASHHVDMHAGFVSMFVYTDIIDYQAVGDSFVPLLRCVHISGHNNDVVTIIYDKPHYLTVSKATISDIIIEVKSDLGKDVPFRYGKFIAKLHFRPAKQRLLL